MPAGPKPNPHVLLVDDEPRFRELMGSVLPSWGYRVSSARSAEDARRVEAAAAEAADPVDLLLLDLNLPGAGGLDFLEDLRRRRPDVPVIILTGYGDLDAAQRAIRLDVVDFLKKPVPLGQLEQSLDRARRRIVTRLPTALDDGSDDSERLRDEIDHADDHPADYRRGDPPRGQGDHIDGPGGLRAKPRPGPGETLEDVERRHILATLRRNGGNRTATAIELGISRRTLQYRLAEYQQSGHLGPDE